MASRAATGRLIAIVVALALALGGVFLLWRYVAAADQRAQEGAVLTDVFIATGGIPQGTTAQAAVQNDLIVLDQVPAANVPQGAVSRLEQISGQVATAAILPGEVIQTARFGDPTLANAVVDIPPDRVAMSLQVGVPEGVAGYLTPGDRIGVIGHLAVDAQDPPVVGPDGEVIGGGGVDSQASFESNYVATDVEVLAVGQRVIGTDQAGNEVDQVQQTELVLVTVAVTPADAERLTFMHYQGQMYFTALPEGFEVPDTQGQDAESVFG